MGKVVLLASGKGGCGKTTTAVNLGVALANQGKRVIVLDLNCGFRNDDIYLGLENFLLFDLGDAASGLCGLDKSIVEHDMVDNLSLLVCPQGKDIEGFGPDHYAALYARLKAHYDYVLVDLPQTNVENIRAYCKNADKAIIVLTQDYVSVRNSETVVRIMAGEGISDRMYLLSMVDSEYYDSEYLPDMDFIVKAVSARFIGAVPFDREIHYANNSGEPIANNINSSFSKLYADIAGRLC